MLLESPIMLLSIIPKTSLLCSKLCSGILSDNVKFNKILYMKKIHVGFLHSLSSDIHLHYDSYNVAILLNSSLLIIAFITYLI